MKTRKTLVALPRQGFADLVRFHDEVPVAYGGGPTGIGSYSSVHTYPS